MPREHYGRRNPQIVQRTRDAIQAELAQRGFEHAELRKLTASGARGR